MTGSLASIDCGTNSTRLLVVDEAGTTVERLMRITRLGQGTDATGRLAPEAVDRTMEVLREYRKVMDATLRALAPERAGRTLQITGVYGELTPVLARSIADLHLCDVAPVQLEAAARKLEAAGLKAELACMDAEALTYPDASFDTAVMFLLLHEMPPAARRRALAEAVRVLKPGGSLVIAEYGEKRGHFFHRFAPMRWLLEWAERDGSAPPG